MHKITNFLKKKKNPYYTIACVAYIHLRNLFTYTTVFTHLFINYKKISLLWLIICFSCRFCKDCWFRSMFILHINWIQDGWLTSSASSVEILSCASSRACLLGANSWYLPCSKGVTDTPVSAVNFLKLYPPGPINLLEKKNTLKKKNHLQVHLNAKKTLSQ